MGFREDVAIRVEPDGDDSRVDIRSSSRYFKSDLGSNAARISRLSDDLTTAAQADSLRAPRKQQVGTPGRGRLKTPARSSAKSVRR
jgi:hypothetical protein